MKTTPESSADAAPAYEVKAALGATPSASEFAVLRDEMLRMFETYKDVNDQRLDEIDHGRSPDPLITEQLARLDKRLDELQIKSSRPQLSNAAGSAAAPTTSADRYRKAFEGFIRKGDEAGLRLESKAMSIGSQPDGGVLVPPETERAVNMMLIPISPIRAIASVQTVSTNVYQKPFATTGIGTGWVAETAARPQTTTSTLADLQFPTMELYAMPAATSNLLEDSIVNIDQWLAEEIGVVFAQQEGQAFISGDGVVAPKGFLTYPSVPVATWSWGNLGYLITGNAGALPATSPADVLIDLIYSLKAGYRMNGRFVMNRRTQATIRKIKDSEGTYLWQPPASPTDSPAFMGYPVTDAEDMPDVAAGSVSVAFGDFKRGYLVVDRAGIRVLRDPYTAKPYVLFYTTKRVGGGIQDFDAIKLLKFSAT